MSLGTSCDRRGGWLANTLAGGRKRAVKGMVPCGGRGWQCGWGEIGVPARAMSGRRGLPVAKQQPVQVRRRCLRLGMKPYGYPCDIPGRLGTHPQKAFGELTPQGWRDARAQRDETSPPPPASSPPDDRAADPHGLTWRLSAGRAVNRHGPSLPTSAASPPPSLSPSPGLPRRARSLTGRADGYEGHGSHRGRP
jgi:hypothetical protein